MAKLVTLPSAAFQCAICFCMQHRKCRLPRAYVLEFFPLSAWIHSGRVKLCYGICPSSGVLSLEVYLLAKSSYGNINCTLQAEDSDSGFFPRNN